MGIIFGAPADNKVYPAPPLKISGAALVALVALAAAGTAGPLSAQVGGPEPRAEVRVRVRLVRVPPVDSVRVPVWLRPRFLGVATPRERADRWAEGVRQALADAEAVRRRLRLGAASEAGRAEDGDDAFPLQLPGLEGLGLDLGAHLEMRLDRLRNLRCSAQEFAATTGCQEGFPTPSFDQQFRVRSAGVVSQRLNVNVDFDSERAFDANNDISVWYEGRPGEFVRRIEVGNVTFRAPASQFVTAAIPSNSFGLQAEAQAGAWTLRAVVAQQKGSSLRTRTFTIGETATQRVELAQRDLDFEGGRFLFVVDPRDIPGFPAVDVLNLDQVLLPAGIQPLEVRVYRLQTQSGRAEGNPNLGGVEAVAVRRDGPERVGPFDWQLLVEGWDYFLDPSRLWLALARRLDAREFLAVSYVTAAGDTVGTFPAATSQGDTLELIYRPDSDPQDPTFFHEMRNVYRVGGPEIVRSTIDLALRVNDSERPLGADGTYLSRLGLAVTTDASTLDEFNRVFPRPRDPNGGAPIRDLFLVFPHLTPFADDTRLLAAERNDSLYRTPSTLLNTEGPSPRFALRFAYEASGAGDPGSLSLGALQLREGSERVFVRGQQLVRGRDYQVDYALGQLQFLNPDSLFAGPTEVRVQFEENQLFDIAPKTVFGVSSTYDLGARGSVSAVAMLQRDRTNFTRPQLGFEPQSHMIGGVSADLRFPADALTRALDGLPLIETEAPSSLTIGGEVAVSRPNPNQLGLAFVEDFQGRSTANISLAEGLFQFGSAPLSGRGLPATHLGVTEPFGPADAAALVWQNVVRDGATVLDFAPRDIDSTIALIGTGFEVETVLWLTLKPDTVGGAPDAAGEPRWLRPHTPGPRWRSVTQPLGRGAGVGLDLSRAEFLEFWVLEDAAREARAQDAVLVFDFGTVLEDAVAFAPDTLRVASGDTTFTGQRFVGVGRLDTERDSLTNVFNAAVDDVGLPQDLLETVVDEATGAVVQDVPLCDVGEVVGVPVFGLGSLSAVCSRRNGRLDTEDVDGDNRLDVDVGAVTEDVLRYVFPVGDPRYFVREGGTVFTETGSATWRLYRIPFREDSLQIGTPTARRVRALRMTLVAPPQGPDEREFSLALARVELVGAPWLKRAATPILGLGGSQGELHGEVVAAVVGTESVDLGYESPPGLGDVGERQGQGFEVGQSQINERALRLLARDLRLGERAEAFVRFADEADRNFLEYRQLRVWARGRGAGWSEGDLEFYAKVGWDEHNFYLYRVPVRTDSWEPEVVIDLERWLALRARTETAWLRGDPPSGGAACGADTTAYVACDGPYLVQVRDPGVSPPNLARVSEVAVGIFRADETVAIDQAELWVNDIRLGDVVGRSGIAVALNARLRAADVAELYLAVANRDDQFRQLGEEPPYVADRSTRVGGSLRLDRFLPASWGLSVPVSVEHLRTSADPFFVQGTDLRADSLADLRRPRAAATRLDVAFRRTREGSSFLGRTLLDPLSVRFRRESATQVASLDRAETVNRQAQFDYALTPGAATVAGAPGFVVRLVEKLPAWIRNSEFGRALRASRLRLNPFTYRFSSTLTDHATERLTFRVPVELPSDSAVRPLPSLAHRWRNRVAIELRPYTTLRARLDYVSDRDLQDYGDSTTVGRLVEGERRKLFGADVGFERRRAMVTLLSVSPAVASWLRPRLTVTTSYLFERDPNGRSSVPSVPDGGRLRVPETVSNSRRREVGASLDLRRLVSGVAGDSSGAARLVRGLLPTDVSHTVTRRSSFDRAPFETGLGYQLGSGGIDAFLEQEGVPATGASEETVVTVGGGVLLPLGARLRLAYRDLDRTVWTRLGAGRTEVVQRNREWPSLSFGWSHDPQGGIRAVMTSVNAQLQYRVSASSSVRPVFGAVADVGASSAVVTENTSNQVAPSLTIAWQGGVTTAGRYSLSRTESFTAGNVTEGEREDWSGRLAFSFGLPQSFVRLRERIRATMVYNSSKTAVCLLRPDAEQCRTVSDSRRQRFDVRLDTGLSRIVRGGATFSYVLSDERHTSNRLSQVVFTVFADINLLAGQEP